ncbi:hypothetical protein [Demequina sp.]|uniref:hypothetical protein n=1 Tax=Demequina sp. TaxID=2050685 RepID=UPI003D107407
MTSQSDVDQAFGHDFAVKALFRTFEGFAQTVHTDLQVARIAAEGALNADDRYAHAARVIQRRRPDLGDTQALALVTEPLRQLLAAVDAAQDQPTEESLLRVYELLARIAEHETLRPHLAAPLSIAAQPSASDRARAAFLVLAIGFFEHDLGEVAVVLASLPPGQADPSDEDMAAAADAMYSKIEMEAADRRLDLLAKDYGIRAADPAPILEHLARRNTLAHTRGRATARYFNRSGSAADMVEQNAVLRVSDQYLAGAIQAIQTTFASVVLEAIDAYALTTRDEIVEGVLDYGYRLLTDDRDALAFIMFDWCIRQQVKDVSIADRARVNRWLVIKRAGRLDEIEEDVRAWDTGGLAPLYQLARHALLDNRDEMSRVAQAMVDAEQATYATLSAQPLFASLRVDSQPPSPAT